MKDLFKGRIYYEDTDAGGIVYYANYLKFAERARTELLRKAGFSQRYLATSHNLLFVVKKADLDLLKPFYLDDEYLIKSEISASKAASLTFKQEFFLAKQKHAVINVLIVAVNQKFRPVIIPKSLKEKLLA